TSTSWKTRSLRLCIRRISVLAIVAFALLVAAPRARALNSGDAGTVECRATQIDAQNAVRRLGQANNLWEVMGTARGVVGSAEQTGQITGACAGCIIRQFSPRISLGDQQRCGPDCPPGFEAVTGGCGEVKILCVEQGSTCGVGGIDCCAACLCADEACCAANP